MWTVSARYLEAIRAPHAKITKAVHRNLITGVETVLPVKGGSVSINSRARVRRQLSLTIPNQQSLWDALETVGGEITVTKTLRYVNGETETVPVGVFVVDQDQIGYSSDGDIQITAPDRWVKVQRNRFGITRSSVPSNTAHAEIQRLVEAAWPGATYLFPGWASGSPDTSATTKVGSLLWDDGDRDAAIGQLCTDNSLDVYFDAEGLAVLRPVPTLSPSSPFVWSVDAGDDGVMVSADRTRDRSSVHNAIILTTSATDVTFAPVEVKQTTVGDPLSVDGPLGYVPLEYSSPTLRNSGQATAAGMTMLSTNLGVAKTITLTAAPNDALDGWDVIRVVLPQIDRATPRPVEIHIIDTASIPLAPGDAQDIQTRSTRPDTDGT